MSPPISQAQREREKQLLETPQGGVYEVLKKLTPTEKPHMSTSATPVQRVSLSIGQLFLILGGIATVVSVLVGGGWAVWSKLDTRITSGEAATSELKTTVAILKANQENIIVDKHETSNRLLQISDMLSDIKAEIARVGREHVKQ